MSLEKNKQLEDQAAHSNQLIATLKTELEQQINLNSELSSRLKSMLAINAKVQHVYKEFGETSEMLKVVTEQRDGLQMALQEQMDANEYLKLHNNRMTERLEKAVDDVEYYRNQIKKA